VLESYGAKIETVAIDISPSYTVAVKLNLPQAVIVFHHFHIIKLFNQKLSDLRRNIYQNLNAAGKSVLKGVRWLLLKNARSLSDYSNFSSDRGELEKITGGI
jgi:transposase